MTSFTPYGPTKSLPDWLDEFRPFLLHTGGQDLEELLRPPRSMDPMTTAATIRYTSVQAQIALLQRLHHLGYLNTQLIR